MRKFTVAATLGRPGLARTFAQALASPLLALWTTFAFAQNPNPVPALPDAPRITTYSISASTCSCSVGMAIFADNQDVDNWIQVFIGTSPKLSTDPSFGWKLTSPSGSIGTIARPITDAVLTFNQVQTGTVTIVGARRPRRVSQFPEGRGVAARDLNQADTDQVAMLRESWDKLQSALVGQPGETILRMPPAATRANQVLAFDGSGNPTVVAVPSSIPSGQVTGPGSSTIGHPATWGNTLGTALVDTPVLGANVGGTGNSTLTAHGLLLGQGTSPTTSANPSAAGQILIDQGAGADPAFKAVMGDVTLASSGAVTLVPVTGSKIASATITSANIASATITSANIAAGTITNSNLAQPAGFNLAARFGGMDVWQRGAGGSASIAVGASTTAYTVDGCYLATGANEASTVAAVAGIATGSFKAAAVTRNSGQTGTTSIVFGCPFDTDEIAQFAGSFVTLSFTASTGANWSPASGNLTYELFCGTGSVKKQTTGYTNQTTPINTTQAIAAGTAAARYQSTSAAIVPANCTQAEIQFNWTPVGTAGAADTITIDDVQLEIAPNSAWTASPYQHLDLGRQLSMAQRHFAKTFPYGTAPAQNAGLTGALFAVGPVATTVGVWYNWNFPRQMRAIPGTVTSFNPSVANANCRDVAGAADLTFTDQSGNIPLSADRWAFTCAAPAAANHQIAIHVTADAGI